MYQSLPALHASVKCRSETGVRWLLLNFGVKVNAKDNYGNTPLHLPVQLSYLDQNRMQCIIKLLLAKGANVNDRTNSGESAFHYAIINGDEKLIKLFLKHGADVNAKNSDGKSPLYLAVQYSNKSIVKMMLEKGAEINNGDNNGNSPLHVAIEVEDESIIKILLEDNAGVNFINKNGKTPLSLAFELAYMRSIYNPWIGFFPINLEIKCSNNTFELLL